MDDAARRTGWRLAYRSWSGCQSLRWLVVGKLAIMFVVPEKQGLFTDWNAHLSYFPIFLFGFALWAAEEQIVARNRPICNGQRWRSR